ncbi:SDR family NAD(P)-dependent oxidoreductase [Rhizobium sp. SG741]|uniref:SDR family NAD(P)-dependent oxidoreductase n=1 Tax=Rhizobium sp. SG741 TaxID=2587114 RepID=UPI000AFA913B|nr:SDR family NAD(P)-dependent oxidoreductase [Rhizobium sp. SG741]NKJ07144.1 NAD(P)-dependent dehydrogenase (short-subunit alcohol dehydrogenase family) [Rhizobium sp. SG741]
MVLCQMSARPKILITGATDGIGQLAALSLARYGAHLILTARSKAKADQTCAAIEAIAPGTPVDVHFVDFSDLAAVVRTGKAIAARHPRIDVLINNAGLHAFEQRVTADGYAEMIAVNYFAPWLLTDTLRETLVHSAPSRIVTVGSEASRQSGAFDIEKDLLDIRPLHRTGIIKDLWPHQASGHHVLPRTSPAARRDGGRRQLPMSGFQCHRARP